MEAATQVASGLCSLFLLGSVGTVGVRATIGAQALPQVPAASASAPASSPSQLSLEDRADIFMARKSYADALDYYGRALREHPSDKLASAKIWNKIGIAYQQDDQLALARKAYNKAIHFNDNMAEAWNNMGTTYFFENKYKKSLKYYQHSIAIDPNSPSFHVNLGTSYSRIKRYAEAIDEYRVALTLDPTVLAQFGGNGTVVQPREVDADYFFYLAKVFASLGRTPEAVRYLRRAFEEGFDNFKKLDQDPDFLKISKDPVYSELRTNPPLAIKD
ncbi:MAG TPA: tetratricopeptide repeat protein [Terriglobia bacterium]|nr:tetratricopeptide repeat protein [Terriglobia bacterium]